MKFKTPLVLYDAPRWEDYKVGQIKAHDILWKIMNRLYQRTILSEQQNHNCCFCGYTMTIHRNRKRSSTVEHIIPKCQGGSDDMENLAASCNHCNQKRGSLPWEEFFKKVRKFKKC